MSNVVMTVTELESKLATLAASRGKIENSKNSTDYDIGIVMLSYYKHYETREAHERAVNVMKTSWKNVTSADLAYCAKLAFLSDFVGQKLYDVTGLRNYRRMFTLIKPTSDGMSFKKDKQREYLSRIVKGGANAPTHQFHDEKRAITITDVLTSETIFEACFGNTSTKVKVTWGVAGFDGKPENKIRAALIEWANKVSESSPDTLRILADVLKTVTIDIVEPTEKAVTKRSIKKQLAGK